MHECVKGVLPQLGATVSEGSRENFLDRLAVVKRSKGAAV